MSLSDMADLAERGLASIDIVVVTLGPSRRRSAAGRAHRRGRGDDRRRRRWRCSAAAARNFGGVAAVCDPADYALLVDELRQHGHVSAEVRQRLAAKAFAALAAYHGEVAAYLDHIGGVRFPEQLSLVLRKERDLPYGENPHQRGALYRETTHRARSLADAERLQGPEPTFNDLIDLDAAFRMASDFASPTCAIVKQRNPVGLASHDDGREAFRRALSGDPGDRLRRGGGRQPRGRRGHRPRARVQLLRGRGRARLQRGRQGPAGGPPGAGRAGRAGTGGRSPCPTTASPSSTSTASRAGCWWRPATAWTSTMRSCTSSRGGGPTLEELTDLMFAWRAVRHITSLAVVVAKGATLVGVGAGQSSRLTATEIALHRAADRAPRSVLASDAYFPFGDAIALAAERGVTAIIQPGGSVRDEMAIEIADRHHLAMVFTGRRHFRH